MAGNLKMAANLKRRVFLKILSF